MAHRNDVSGSAGRTKDQEADRISVLISQNIHLEGRTKYFLEQQCHKYEELHDLVVRIGNTFNGALAHELVFIIASILMAKLQDYEEINIEELDYVPQMECIFGEEGEEEPMVGGWKAHSELEDCELARFSKRNINRLSSLLFFDSDLKIVTFRSSQLPYNLKSQIL